MSGSCTTVRISWVFSGLQPAANLTNFTVQLTGFVPGPAPAVVSDSSLTFIVLADVGSAGSWESSLSLPATSSGSQPWNLARLRTSALAAAGSGNAAFLIASVSVSGARAQTGASMPVLLLQPAAPVVSITSPSFSTVWTLGKTTTVSWRAARVPPDTAIALHLVYMDNGQEIVASTIRSPTTTSLSPSAQGSVQVQVTTSLFQSCPSVADPNGVELLVRAQLVQDGGLTVLTTSYSPSILLQQPAEEPAPILSILSTRLASCDNVTVSYEGLSSRSDVLARVSDAGNLGPDAWGVRWYLTWDRQGDGQLWQSEVTTDLPAGTDNLARLLAREAQGSTTLSFPLACCIMSGRQQSRAWSPPVGSPLTATRSDAGCPGQMGMRLSLERVLGAPPSAAGSCSMNALLSATAEPALVLPDLPPTVLVSLPTERELLSPAAPVTIVWSVYAGTGIWRQPSALLSSLQVSISLVRPAQQGTEGDPDAPSEVAEVALTNVSLATIRRISPADSDFVTLSVSWSPSPSQWAGVALGSTARVAQVCLATRPGLGLPDFSLCRISPRWFRVCSSSLSLVTAGPEGASVWIAGDDTFPIAWTYEGSPTDAFGALVFDMSLVSAASGQSILLRSGSYSPVSQISARKVLYNSTFTIPVSIPRVDVANRWDVVVSFPACTASVNTATSRRGRSVIGPSMSYTWNPRTTVEEGSTVIVPWSASRALVSARARLAFTLMKRTGSGRSARLEPVALLFQTVADTEGEVGFAVPTGVFFPGAYLIQATSPPIPDDAGTDEVQLRGQTTVPTLLWDSPDINIQGARTLTVVQPSQTSSTTIQAGSAIRLLYSTQRILSSSSMTVQLVPLAPAGEPILVSSSTLRNNGLFSWSSPLLPPASLSSSDGWPFNATYALRVCDSPTTTAQRPVCGTSGVIRITPRPRIVTVLEPPSVGTVWSAGQRVRLSWGTSGFDVTTATVTLELRAARQWAAGGDPVLVTIARSVLARTGSLTYTVPSDISSLEPVYVVASVDGSGLWGRSPAFRIESAPRPGFIQFLDSVCSGAPSDRRPVDNIPGELCLDTCDKCAARGGVWVSGARVQLTFGSDLGNRTILTDSAQAQLSALLGAFQGNMLSLCLPRQPAADSLSFSVGMDLFYARRIFGTLLPPPAVPPTATFTVTYSAADRLVPTGSTCTPPRDRLLTTVAIPIDPCSPREQIMQVMHAVACSRGVPVLRTTVVFVTDPLCQSGGSGGSRSPVRFLQASGTGGGETSTGGSDAGGTLPLIPVDISVQSDATDAETVNSFQVSLGPALSTALNIPASSVSVSTVTTLAGADQVSARTAATSPFTANSATFQQAFAVPAEGETDAAESRPLVGSSVADLSSSALTDGSAAWVVSTQNDRSLSNMGAAVASSSARTSRLRRFANAIIDLVGLPAAIGIAVSAFALVVGGIVAFVVRRRRVTKARLVGKKGVGMMADENAFAFGGQNTMHGRKSTMRSLVLNAPSVSQNSASESSAMPLPFGPPPGWEQTGAGVGGDMTISHVNPLMAKRSMNSMQAASGSPAVIGRGRKSVASMPSATSSLNVAAAAAVPGNRFSAKASARVVTAAPAERSSDASASPKAAKSPSVLGRARSTQRMKVADVVVSRPDLDPLVAGRLQQTGTSSRVQMQPQRATR